MGVIMLADKSITPRIDWSWLPAGLSDLVSGILGVAVYASVAALVVSTVLFVWTKMTETKIDNPRGLEALIAVMIGSVAVAGLGTLVQWGIGIAPTAPIHF